MFSWFNKDNAALQLTLIRIYIGLDFTHHFAEKFGLLGPKALADVTHYFQSVGMSAPSGWNMWRNR